MLEGEQDIVKTLHGGDHVGLFIICKRGVERSVAEDARRGEDVVRGLRCERAGSAVTEQVRIDPVAE
jgi:hypothetical protein